MSTIIESRMRFVEKMLAHIEEQLDASLRGQGMYALSNGGKRLRPILCILICELQGGTPSNTVNAFTALELIHNATLIHDDILDQDHYRRGKQSLPVKYDVKSAVITGDALFSLGLKHATYTENHRIIEWLSETSLKMVTGIQKQGTINGRIASIEELMEINYLKSGSLFEAAAALGAISAEASSEEVSLMAKLGRLYGDAYQINDDLQDMEADGEKTPRGDLENGDLTLPILYALQSDEISEKEKKILTSNSLTNTKKSSIKEILSRSSATLRCREKIEKYLDEATEILKQYSDSDAREGLFTLLENLRG